MLEPSYVYKALVTEVYDGDTIYVTLDMGLHHKVEKFKLRLVGVDAPELHETTVDGRPDEKTRAAARAARDWLAEQINAAAGLVTVKTYKTEKYGRWLSDVYIGERHLNAELVATGHAVPYMVGA